ncbi:craniofacial development protein 1-like isoform X2 [Convolutriloba macropyga]|uniref:craniofacial development protein 1-like isoform X2 n=1 Tax=Convolutriloba macropyga TaxID=536237 RepID=UPI003F51E11C
MTTVSTWVKNLEDVNSDDDDSEDDDWVPPPEKEEEQPPPKPDIDPENVKQNEENERKRKANLWDSFLSGVKRPKKDQNLSVSKSNPKLSEIKTDEEIKSNVCNQPEAELKEVQRVYDFAGEEIVITEKVSVKSLLSSKSESSSINTQTKEAVSQIPAHDLEEDIQTALSTVKSEHPKPGGGSNLTSIVGALGKKKKMGTLQKSALDWESFKSKEGESLQEELESHRKGKNSFLDRKDFLERVDWNQFENERVIRQVERKRQNNLN